MINWYMRSMRWQWAHPWKWFILNIVAYAAMMGIFHGYTAHVERKNAEFDRTMDMLKQQREHREAMAAATTVAPL